MDEIKAKLRLYGITVLVLSFSYVLLDYFYFDRVFEYYSDHAKTPFTVWLVFGIYSAHAFFWVAIAWYFSLKWHSYAKILAKHLGKSVWKLKFKDFF